MAEEGTEYVITRYRKMDSNYGVLLSKLVRRAGITMWPKPFQNLRATRETELAEDFPMHVVCEWIGNSQLVAAKHYLHVTDDHFAQARSDQSLQNALQQTHETARKAPQPASSADPAAQAKTPDMQGFANDCDDSRELAKTALMGMRDCPHLPQTVTSTLIAAMASRCMSHISTHTP